MSTNPGCLGAVVPESARGAFGSGSNGLDPPLPVLQKLNFWADLTCRFIVVVVTSALMVSVFAAPGSAATYGSTTTEWQVVNLVNQHRVAAGCPALNVDVKLNSAARGHSLDMANRGYFDHNTPDGRTPWQRMSAAGYPGGGSAENIAAGQTTAAQVVQAWMDSPGHRANILNCALRAVGTGIAIGGPYGVYWTQDFGTVVTALVNPPTTVTPPMRHYVSNSFGGTSSASFDFGRRGDRPVVCDFDANGKDSVAVFRSGVFYVRNALSAGPYTSFRFGSTGDLPVCGDWNGDGKETVGVYRPSTASFYLRNSNSAGLSNYHFYLGQGGDLPVVGDWNGDGVDTVGIYRPSAATYYLINGNAQVARRLIYRLGNGGDKPYVGDFAGNGKDTLGVRRGKTFYVTTVLGSNSTKAFSYGSSTDVAFSGDWDGNNVDTVGVSR